MSFFLPQNPGIGGLDELTSSEESTVQTITALGTPGQYLRTNLAGTTVEWSTVSGSGDVVKVGTPVNNQLGVWTGDGTLEGDAALTFDTATDTLAIAASGILAFGAVNILTDSAGTMTLNNIDALDATTEATIESAIDTLANLTTIQGRTVTLADAGANAVFGWDDVAGAYENLTAAEITAIPNAFVGDSGAGGTKGMVPAPAIGDSGKYLKGDGTWATVSGSGDVVGPASSTDNAVVRFDGTTGKLVQNSGVTIGDNADVSITIANAANVNGLTITQNDATNDKLPLKIVTASENYGIEIESTEAGGYGAGISLYHNSASPAALDIISEIDFLGKDSGGNLTQYGQIQAVIVDATNASEDAEITFSTMVAGTSAKRLTVGSQINGVAVGDGVSDGIVQSQGNFNLKLQTGNATTGNITIVDGANGAIQLNPNGTGSVGLNTHYVGISNGSESTVELMGDAADGSAFDLNSGAGATSLKLTDTSAAASGPIIELYHNSASPAASDVVGTINFYGEDSGSGKQLYSYIDTSIVDTTAASEDAYLSIRTVTGGTTTGKGVDISGTYFRPATNDGLTLGDATSQFSDLFLAEGGVINWDNGDVTLTQSGNTLTLAGGDFVLSENTSIALDPAGSADGKYSGITVAGTAGTALAFGDLCYLDPTDSRWELADANAATAADGDARGILGICVLAAAADGNATTMLLEGIVRADAAFPALTIGAPVYVSETAGDIVVTQPTTTDVVIRIVGVAITADEIFFRPDFTWVTHT